MHNHRTAKNMIARDLTFSEYTVYRRAIRKDILKITFLRVNGRLGSGLKIYFFHLL